MAVPGARPGAGDADGSLSQRERAQGEGEPPIAGPPPAGAGDADGPLSQRERAQDEEAPPIPAPSPAGAGDADAPLSQRERAQDGEAPPIPAPLPAGAGDADSPLSQRERAQGEGEPPIAGPPPPDAPGRSSRGRGRRTLALDVGDARIGLAVSDPTGTLPTPLAALARSAESDDIAAVLRVAREKAAVRIVVGLPLSLDGSRGPRARLTLRFASALRLATDIPVETWDERFSTAEAERRMREAGVQPSRDRARLDSAAAAVILEAYLAARPG